jgi:transcriptional regulator NrdR family protein
MNCPDCGEKTIVTDGRLTPRSFRRWRKCPKCKRRFVTYEIPEEELSVKMVNKLRTMPLPRPQAK